MINIVHPEITMLYFYVVSGSCWEVDGDRRKEDNSAEEIEPENLRKAYLKRGRGSHIKFLYQKWFYLCSVRKWDWWVDIQIKK